MQAEKLLLAVLNSAPVIDGSPTDQLDGVSGARFARLWGGSGSAAEVERLRQTRSALHAIVRGDSDQRSGALDQLTAVLHAAEHTATVTPVGVSWEVGAPADDRLAVRTVLAWSEIVERFPGRLRACANHECNLFLLDHSRPGTAKWCSMAACGNRMKARAHADRARTS